MPNETSHIDATIAALEGWRDRIDVTIATLRYLQAQGPAIPGLPPSPSARADQADSEISHDTFFQMTVPDAAEKYLTFMKRTKPANEIGEALLNGGLKSGSKNFVDMLRSIISRDARFVRVNGEWGLTTWYPGMRKKPKTDAPAETLKPKTTPVSKAEKTERKQSQPGPDSVQGKVLKLLNSKPDELFDARMVSEALEVANVDSVRTALSVLFAAGLISKPSTGHYRAIKNRAAA